MNSSFSPVLPLAATRLTVILANGAAVRNTIARFGGRPMRDRMGPRSLNRSYTSFSIAMAASSLRISASSVGVCLVKMPVLVACGQFLSHASSIGRETFSTFCHLSNGGFFPVTVLLTATDRYSAVDVFGDHQHTRVTYQAARSTTWHDARSRVTRAHEP